MNVVQKAVLAHLTKDGHPERPLALEDLINLGAMSISDDAATTRGLIERYLRANPRGFCAGGIQRLRSVAVVNRRTVVYQIEVDVVADDAITGTCGVDGPVGRRMREILRGAVAHNNKGKKRQINDVRILTARWKDE